MKEKYFINGWEYGKQYFLSVGGFTLKEKIVLENGGTVTKNGNDFWIITEEWE